MLKPPQTVTDLTPHPLSGDAVLRDEIIAEQAASLGEAGRRAEAALERLADAQQMREALLKEAVTAVHHYFIQRELCGLRNHEPVIRALKVPSKVLARLGAC